jgi:CRP-like cAMP-binding protein
MANWKKYTEVNKKKLNGQVSNLKKSSALKQGMLRGRKQGLFKLLKTKARSVSAAKRVWQRSVAANITHDRLIKTTILPSWLPLNMRKLYLAPDTSTRDLERAIEIFDRMVLRRSEVWPRACRAMAYCLLSEKSSCEATSQKYLKLAEKELTICLQKKLEKDRGDLLYNRSVVRLRQGHIDTSIQDLNEVIQLYNRDNRNLENKFLLATLHNRSFVQRRFGNFVRSFADLTMLHNTKQEHENNKNNTQINRRNSCSNNGNDDAHKIWHHNDETIVQRSSFNGIRSGLPNDSPSTSPLQETNSSQMPSFSLVDNALHPMLASSSFDPQPETMEQSVEDGLPLSLSSKYVSGVPSDSSSDSSSNSSSDSYSDSSSDEAESGSFHSTNLVQHRRNSMIGNLGSIHKEALLGSTTKNNIHANDSPVDHTDTHLHALEILQNFSDSQLEKKLDSEKQNTDQKIVHTHSAIEIVMMNEKQKNKAIEDGLKHMFNKTLPTNVYDALHVPVELRTRKHWKSIRFVTDTMKAFADYPEMLKNYLVKVLTLSDSTVDTYICREGDPADNFYVVVAGYLRVEVKHPNDKTATIVVNRMGPGASFGELSLVFDQNRAASVISDAKHVSLLVIPKTQFHDLGLAQYHLALLQEKYATLCCNRLFDSWSDEALTALAQIAQVKTFQQHTKILKQDSRPDYFHILRKGVSLNSLIILIVSRN